VPLCEPDVRFPGNPLWTIIGHDTAAVEAVAPGGHLLVRDYDLSVVATVPSLPAVEALNRLMTDIFGGLGCDVRTGAVLPTLFAEAGAGAPDSTEIAGALASLTPAYHFVQQTVCGVLPAADYW
jgi:hypothetical protein